MTEISIEQLNQSDDAQFVETLKDIFEHSPWVAERASPARPYTSIRKLHSHMVAMVAQASMREQLDLIRAHPDLAGKAALAGELTESSTSEQAGAGLDTLTDDEFERFHALNNAYKAKFGFPFILAVKGHDKHSILASFDTRLKNDETDERTEALKQIGEIARFRLEALISPKQ